GSCASPSTYDLSLEPDGTYTFSARATDAAGNTGAVTTSTYTLSTTRPPAPSIDTAAASPGRSPSPSWSFSVSEAGDTFQCRLLAALVVLERGGRDLRVPADARHHAGQRLGELHERALLRPVRPAGRHVHLRGPRHRPGGQHRRAGDQRLRPRRERARGAGHS